MTVRAYPADEAFHRAQRATRRILDRPYCGAHHHDPHTALGPVDIICALPPGHPGTHGWDTTTLDK